MDWPSLALVTYAFLLALLLTGIILRSLRETKGRYQKILEEKEQMLAAMQLDAEDTLEALEMQAVALETEWNEAGKRGQNSVLAVQQRLLELQGALVSVQARLSRLEQATARLPAEHTTEDFLAAKHAETNVASAAPDKPAPEEILEDAYTAQKEPAEDGSEPPASAEPEPPRQRALALLQKGWGIAQVSRELGCSRTEATLLYSQWRRGYLKENMANSPED
ncbi:MAG: hypothetical protein VB049_02480 [Candidatus Pelethousia sp.]|nr:hypothetical protein [Candidatus Pelethousia sp.]